MPRIIVIINGDDIGAAVIPAALAIGGGDPRRGRTRADVAAAVSRR